VLRTHGDREVADPGTEVERGIERSMSRGASSHPPTREGGKGNRRARLRKATEGVIHQGESTPRGEQESGPLSRPRTRKGADEGVRPAAEGLRRQVSGKPEARRNADLPEGNPLAHPPSAEETLRETETARYTPPHGLRSVRNEAELRRESTGGK